MPNMEGSVSEQAAPIAQEEKVLTANELFGYKSDISKEDAIRKRPVPIYENVRNRTWMSQELSIYSNSEYAYAIFPIEIGLFWDRWGRQIAESKALSMIFTILTHCPNTTPISNFL